MRDPRLKFQDREFTTLCNDRKYGSKCTAQRETRIWRSKCEAYIKDADTSLKSFVSHELQMRVLYMRPTFKASRHKVHHAHV